MAANLSIPSAHAACMGMELQAHRGAAGFPENSRSGVEAALNGSWEGAEIDVQMLADGELALHHDAVTSRTTSLSNRMVRNLSSNTWSEVRLKDAKGKITSESAPLLRDLLEMAEASGKVLNVEIKEEFRDCSAADHATRLLLEGMPSGRWGISATNFKHLRCVRKLDRHAYLGAISLDKVSIAMSNKRTASRAHLLKSPDLSPAVLAKVIRDVPPPVGLHVDVFSLRANPNLLFDAQQLRLPVFTYSMMGDSFHTTELRRHFRQYGILPSGAIIDGTPQSFCQKLSND
ncbi:MAG: glycerophosphodiester phosphodiesterase family protein [Comamonadaceae bacterium]|nr:glycerophosphodiester phosphodiesterase family protein [Comamonadaceae bacterium]